jgi:ribosomal protein S18 acetylase RimI-like enzyme
VPAVSATIRQLHSLDSLTARSLVRVFHRSEVSAAYLSDLLSDPKNLLILAEEGAEIVGFVWAHWLDRIRSERKQLFIYEVEVAPQQRRRGVGTQLMHFAIAIARAADADAFLVTNHTNAAAVGLYESLGGKTRGSGDDLLFVFPGASQ